MADVRYEWPLTGEFVGRRDELARMESWWSDPLRQPLAIYGRRRVGKSWLVRRFAHGRQAVVLVAEQLPPGAQMRRFAEQLAPVVGTTPVLDDAPTLLRVLYRAARERPLCVVLDEFPWLLGTSATEISRTLSAVQAVMEDERDASELKLILCGSHVATMESLFTERNPLHGRLDRLEVRPMPFGDVAPFFDPAANPVAVFERYAVAGGMPMYLARLGQSDLRRAICAAILDRDAPLWNEGRAVVEQELREPRIYFALLEQLASGAKDLNEVAQKARLAAGPTSKYLANLTDLRLVSRMVPFGAAPGARSGRWQLDDPFLRFWFRFVFPYQSDLESGLRAGDLFDSDVAPHLPEHVSPVFEAWALEWLRAQRVDLATRWGRWWGPAAHRFRREKSRSSEEIDAVGVRRGRVTAVSESKWTARPIDAGIVHDLRRFKIPALVDAGLPVARDVAIVLFCRSGYSESLRQLAREDELIELVDVPAALASPPRVGPIV